MPHLLSATINEYRGYSLIYLCYVYVPDLIEVVSSLYIYILCQLYSLHMFSRKLTNLTSFHFNQPPL